MKIDKDLQKRVSIKILADVYSCLKVMYCMNVDGLNSDVLIKVLENHFDLHEFEYKEFNYMSGINSICKCIHNNPIKYFNFSFKKSASK